MTKVETENYAPLEPHDFISGAAYMFHDSVCKDKEKYFNALTKEIQKTAFQGIEINDLKEKLKDQQEHGQTIWQDREKIRLLNAELLEALKDCNTWANPSKPTKDWYNEVIAKAEGKE